MTRRASAAGDRAFSRRCTGALVVALAIALQAMPAAGADDADRDLVKAVHVVRTFYRYHLSHDMRFTETTVAKRKEWLSPDFYALLLAEVRRPANPEEAPFVNGDPFTDSQDFPTRVETGAAVRTGEDTITVEVELRWTRRVREYRQYRWERRPVTREVEDAPARRLTVRLSRGQRLWRIDDLLSEGKSLHAALTARNDPTQQLPRAAPAWMQKPVPADPLAPPAPGEPAKPWQPSPTQPWQR